jgi:SAM-dependent methyltransferase
MPSDPFASFKAAQRAGWPMFAPLQMSTIQPAARLVRHAGITVGQRVLDVACGTGVVAITAAFSGAVVTGLDLTPELLERARENAAIAELPIEWHEGDVEAIPFPDDAFDVVVSQFGHIFAPRADVALAEMLRVLKPGGTIAFATWPPEVFVGRMFALVTRYAPPAPAGVQPPDLWGDPRVVRDRLGDAVHDLVFDRGEVRVPALSPAHHRQVTERSAPPVARLVQSLSGTDDGRLESFRREYDALAAQYFEGNAIRQDYLLTRATKR